MVQYVILGDSNLFFCDPAYRGLPWRLFYDSDANVATMIADKLGAPCYFYPLYHLHVSSDNRIRFRSLMDALRHSADIVLILWIGQNDAWDLATRFNVSQEKDSRLLDLNHSARSFCEFLSTLYSFQSIFVLGYHNHSAMSENSLYMAYSQSVLDSLLDCLPGCSLIPMLGTSDTMYVDQSHLTRTAQYAMACHIATAILDFSPLNR